MKYLLKLSGLIDALNERVGRVIMWLILAVVLLSAGNAIARKVFRMSSNALFDLQWYLYSCVFLLGAGYAFLKNVHVRIDFVSSRLVGADAVVGRHRRHHRLPGARSAGC